MPVDRFNRTELLGANVRWLVTVQFAGQVMRLSTTSLDITEAATGKTHHYEGGLVDFKPSRTVGLFQIAEIASVPVEAVLPVDVADRIIAAGHHLAGAQAEIARWIEGTDYSNRRIEMKGQCKDPHIGENWEPVSFSIESNAWEEDQIVPSPGLKVDESTWPDSFSSLMPAEAEVAYPVIYGFPGRTNISTTIGAITAARGWIAASQGVWVDHRRVLISQLTQLKLVIAGHRVAADRVRLVTDAYSAGLRFVVQHTTDSLGNEVAFVDAQVDGALWETADPDSVAAFGLGRDSIDISYQPADATIVEELYPVFVSWYTPAANTGHQSGGKLNGSGEVIRSAGDVIEDMLAYSGKPIDRDRFAAVKPLLSWLKIDAAVEATCKPWDWLRENVFPIAPVSVASGPDGLYMVVWRVDAVASDAVATMDVDNDPSIERASRLRIDTKEIQNDFTLRYAYNARTESYLKSRRLVGTAYDSADPNTRPSLHCRVSLSRYQNSRGDPRVVQWEHKSIVIYDDASAAKVLAWRAAAHAIAKQWIDYVVPEGEWGWLSRGDVVILNHTAMGIVNRVWLVYNIEPYDNGTMGIRLLRFGDPVRDLVIG